ncbi:2'-5' RNA ligase family protein [Labrys sp. LIt4]|uniref:2'-5' RNA ligase family protein n=1 Tax=Labrys sp. LIt4 TaxID=2821355 RepID=UPI001AE0B06A|nr:2'-5' RNA ligase family protein [Labrys sp. LIt4]MBP0582933.1 2'-5' RNA ligase family protein [Labrys sp. LIt4]
MTAISRFTTNHEAVDHCSLFVLSTKSADREREVIMQLAFDFYGELPRGPVRGERLFFAVFPGAEDALRIEQFRRSFFEANHFRGSMLRQDRFHVSLHHIGDFKRLKASRSYAAELAGELVHLPAFEITLNALKSLGTFPKPGRALRHPLVLLGEGPGLVELHETLGAAMTKVGIRAFPDFTPHLTLSYGERSVLEQRIDPIPIHIASFCLVHSRVGKTEYRIIKRWPLLEPKPLLH